MEKNLKTVLRLFPYLDDRRRLNKIKIDEDSIHYISLKEVASKITIIIKYQLEKIGITENVHITDATAGVGGNVISFGKEFSIVNAIEIDELRYEYLINNINVYELKNVNTFNDDCRIILPKIKKHDVVFIDPPWGGKDYKNHEKLTLSLSNTPLETLCNNLLDETKNICCPSIIVLKLPTNYDLYYLYDMVNSKTIYLHELKKMLIVVIVNEKT